MTPCTWDAGCPNWGNLRMERAPLTRGRATDVEVVCDDHRGVAAGAGYVEAVSRNDDRHAMHQPE